MIIRYDGTPPLPPLDPNGASPTRLPTFTWVAASDQTTGGSAIATYRIYRNGAFVGETGGTSFTDAHAVESGHEIYTVRAIDAAGNISGPSRGLDLIVDLEGPILDGVSFPAQRPVGTAVEFQVSPRDALSRVARRRDVGLRRRPRDREQGRPRVLGRRHLRDHGARLGHARQHHGDREPDDPDRDAAGRPTADGAPPAGAEEPEARAR